MLRFARCFSHFAIVAVFAICGRGIFAVFGITLPAFRIAGGALIGLVGFHMLQGEHSAVHSTSEADNEKSRDAAIGIAITPLAIPVLAGPGTIVTAMNYAAESTIPEIARVLSAFALMCAATWATFLVSESLTRFLGQNAIKVVSRLMGLILAVIGVQMLIAGIHGAVGLAKTSRGRADLRQRSGCPALQPSIQGIAADPQTPRCLGHIAPAGRNCPGDNRYGKFLKGFARGGNFNRPAHPRSRSLELFDEVVGQMLPADLRLAFIEQCASRA